MINAKRSTVILPWTSDGMLRLLEALFTSWYCGVKSLTDVTALPYRHGYAVMPTRILHLPLYYTLRRKGGGSEFNARYDHSLRDIDHLSKWCTQQMLTIKQKSDDLRQQIDKRISSQDKKHRKYKAERDDIAAAKTKVQKELVEAKSQLELQETKLKDLKYQLSQQEFDLHLRSDIITSHERQVERTHNGIASFFQSDIKPLIWRFLKTVPPRKISSAMASLGATTHGRHSTPSSENFSHTSTPKQLKKKNSTRIGNPLVV
ncbi:hypothetical protein Tco_1045077 [Tanacetum coccineum]|uniref:Uncharacterized protein n=1 Tax=Tanacetum coccineum TaxID=301880 RepID=A0ABQ5GTX9_9ASTR